MRSPAIRAVAVVIPARDEQETIEACLDSVETALSALPDGVIATVSVVLDRCVDRTPERVVARPGAVALHVGPVGHRAGGAPSHIAAGSGVGALRDLGVRDALARLAPLRPEQVWLLATDADTTVPAHWAREHLRLAGAGAAGVAGMVELAAGPLAARVARRHDELVAALVDGPNHRNAYGANLGVRADAYLAVGGFPADGAGEDQGLWDALDRAGYPLAAPAGLRVHTSARTLGRARGGLADLLRELDDASPA